MKKIKVLTLFFVLVFCFYLRCFAVDNFRGSVFWSYFILSNGATDTTVLRDGETFCFYANCDGIYYDVGNGENLISSTDVYCISEDYTNGTLNLINRCGYSQTVQYFRDYDGISGDYILPSQCDYSGYVLEDDITKTYCTDKFNDLIPSENIDSLYCLNNGLCPSNECTTGEVSSGNWSALYINDIQHIGAPLIDITIPEEFDWDYTGNSELFELDVKGYNTDSDYIAGIINTQKSTPSNDDFNNIITGLIPLFVPGLVIILFITFVFRFLKKLF